jgi:hypothetical protein
MEDEMSRACSMNEEKINQCRTFMGKPEEKGELRKRRSMWVNNIKMYLRDIVWDNMDWIDMVQDRDQRRALMNTVINLRVP